MGKGYYEVEFEKLTSPKSGKIYSDGNVKVFSNDKETRWLRADEKTLRAIKKAFKDQDKREFAKGEQSYDFDKSPRGY